MKKFLLAFLISIPFWCFAQQTTFNSDSAYSYTKYLSETIGPRPMGSAKENEAVLWVKNKLTSFGADTAFVMPFKVAETSRGPIITNSGNAVALFKGKTDSAIVVGGHVDSAGENIPGANDNASGTATMMELARIWAQRDRHYTMIFCAFGGEERGLLGSKYFVDHYDNLENVFFMISTDMGGTAGDIELMFETKNNYVPKPLIKQVFSIANELNIKRLRYTPHFSATNYLGEAGSGSDHMSFLDKGIPAIDFTAGILESAIHTPQDHMQFIDKKYFQEYGLLVDTILQKFQNQQLQIGASSRYFLFPVFGLDLYLPFWLLTVFNIVALVLGLAAFIIALRKRKKIPRKERPRVSGLKLFSLLLITLVFMQLGETVLQIFTGYRYHWSANLNGYIWLTVFWIILGGWAALQITKAWNFTQDAFYYALRFLVIVIIFTVASLFADPRLTFYSAFALFLFSLTVFIENKTIKVALALISSYLIFRLVFNEEFTFILYSMQMVGLRLTSYWHQLVFKIILIAILSLISLPLMNATAYSTFSSAGFKNLLKLYRKPPFGIALGIIIIALSVYLFMQPAYNDMRKPQIEVSATYNMNNGENILTVNGNEYLKDVKIACDSLNTQLNGRENEIEINQPFTADWFNILGMQITRSDSLDTLKTVWFINANKEWNRVIVEVFCDSMQIEDVYSETPHNFKDGKVRFYWRGGVPEAIHLDAKFVIHKDCRLIRKVKAYYYEMPIDLKISSKLANISYRTVVTQTDTLNQSEKSFADLNGIN